MKYLAFEDAIKLRDQLEQEAKIESAKLQEFPRGPMGLVPDEIRTSREYQIARIKYNNVEHKLRGINEYIVKHCKKEYRQYREEKRKGQMK